MAPILSAGEDGILPPGPIAGQDARLIGRLEAHRHKVRFQERAEETAWEPRLLALASRAAWLESGGAPSSPASVCQAHQVFW